MDYFLELFFGGLTRGSIYALIALGYTMVYGIIELINFAHGEIYMIGAFTALIVASVLAMAGWSGLSVLALASVVATWQTSPRHPSLIATARELAASGPTSTRGTPGGISPICSRMNWIDCWISIQRT